MGASFYERLCREGYATPQRAEGSARLHEILLRAESTEIDRQVDRYNLLSAEQGEPVDVLQPEEGLRGIEQPLFVSYQVPAKLGEFAAPPVRTVGLLLQCDDFERRPHQSELGTAGTQGPSTTALNQQYEQFLQEEQTHLPNEELARNAAWWRVVCDQLPDSLERVRSAGFIGNTEARWLLRATLFYENNARQLFGGAGDWYVPLTATGGALWSPDGGLFVGLWTPLLEVHPWVSQTPDDFLLDWFFVCIYPALFALLPTARTAT